MPCNRPWPSPGSSGTCDSPLWPCSRRASACWHGLDDGLAQTRALGHAVGHRLCPGPACTQPCVSRWSLQIARDPCSQAWLDLLELAAGLISPGTEAIASTLFLGASGTADPGLTHYCPEARLSRSVAGPVGELCRCLALRGKASSRQSTNGLLRVLSPERLSRLGLSLRGVRQWGTRRLRASRWSPLHKRQHDAPCCASGALSLSRLLGDPLDGRPSALSRAGATQNGPGSGAATGRVCSSGGEPDEPAPAACVPAQGCQASSRACQEHAALPRHAAHPRPRLQRYVEHLRSDCLRRRIWRAHHVTPPQGRAARLWRGTLTGSTSSMAPACA